MDVLIFSPIWIHHSFIQHNATDRSLYFINHQNPPFSFLDPPFIPMKSSIPPFYQFSEFLKSTLSKAWVTNYVLRCGVIWCVPSWNFNSTYKVIKSKLYCHLFPYLIYWLGGTILQIFAQSQHHTQPAVTIQYMMSQIWLWYDLCVLKLESVCAMLG